MEHTPASGLREAASRPAEENLKRIAEALQRAGSAWTAEMVSTRPIELDRAAVSAMVESPDAEAILRQLDLGALAALVERCCAYLDRAALPPGDGALPDPELRRLAWDLLDQLRWPAVLRRIQPREHEAWARRILTLVERSHLTVGPLLRHRAEAYGSKTLFELPSSAGVRSLSWRQAAGRVELLARGLLSLDEHGEPGPVAFLSDNRIEMALADLACLSSGIVNVMIPANATAADVRYMLHHAGARTVIVSDREQLDKVLASREGLDGLRHIVVIEPQHVAHAEVMTLESVAARAERVPETRARECSEAVRIDELATVMYTSGTTGHPKGIQFSHRNIVFKRFARALAIPEIGDEDVFLCYLPLYHTFGRYLELLGCIFWGATYCFLDNPSVEALVRGMRRYRPTVLISVPRKWIQLYEAITASADPLRASDEELLEATRRTTGGRLRWGLSAAGHLDSEIFRFFQQQGIELMSGFGMTEATGGITMTPPGRYRDDSLGCALPGIELRLEDDGELLIRGPYVMMGYLEAAGNAEAAEATGREADGADPDDETDPGQPSLDADGWLRSGDLMEIDPDGFLRLVDRKKEIYKNVKGETIAPQRIENLFRDFDSVGRVFLVGDHRPYNTVLIYPDPDYGELDLDTVSADEVRDHFRSIVVSVNKFLAPFESIVDFAVIDRDLDVERGELTPKLTPRRKVVERNFGEVIELLYQRTSLRVGRIELIFPNWLFQLLGLTAQDIRIGEERIAIPSSGATLTVRRHGREVVQVGSCLYRQRPGPLNLGSLLLSSQLWMGNEELVEFLSLDLAALERPGRPEEGLEWRGRREPFAAGPEQREALRTTMGKAELSLMDLHAAALMLGSPGDDTAFEALHLLERVLADEEGRLAEPARLLLARTAISGSVELRRRALQVLVPAEKVSRFRGTLDRFLTGSGVLLDGETRAVLVERDFSEEKLDAFIAAADRACKGPLTSRDAVRRAASLLRLLAEYGAAHPVRYRRLRAFLVRSMLFAASDTLREEASRAVDALTRGFRQWLMPSSRIAVDPETGREYRWEDVVVFDEDVDEDHRGRLMSALKNTSLLREGVFLFSGGTTIRLSDIPPRGVWIRLLGSGHGKSVYRMTVQSRLHGSYDLAVNVNESLSSEQIREETNFLILSGDAGQGDPLVEDFGGYWEEQELWSEEFIAGETLERAMRRLARKEEDVERFRQLWPFLAWTTLGAYVDFWNRTGRRWEIADPGMSNVVVPTDDYQTGARIVSITNRRPHRGLVAMLLHMRDEFGRPAEEKYPVLEGKLRWNVILSSVLEGVGEEQGLELLRGALRTESENLPGDLRQAIESYAANVEARGFQPLRLYFAVKRYRRWAELSGEATPRARARTLRELYDTYGLQKLARSYPEMRVRLFRETVFLDAPPPLAEGLEQLIGRLRRRELAGDELIDSIADLRSRLDLGPDEDYFLARLSFPYLQPDDAAAFEMAPAGSGTQSSEVVVFREDHEGNLFRVRHAMNPKEVGRLHQLFLGAKLDVRFRPEHQYLVALNERTQLIGGIYYEVEKGGRTAHLEKIAVAEPFRKKGVADGLMNEFFNRLRASGVRAVTTGFFRPEYFYAHGFKIEKRYAGLVKPLDET